MAQPPTTPMSAPDLPRPFPPDWPVGWGADEYGLFADAYIANILCRMRWIGPGTFLMGSPEEEKDRDGDERLHEVTLTRGFWLCETACPQNLWEVVMGKNPSKHRGPDRPVDSVSWEDCQAFLARANEEFLAGGLRLPTEAEWEYSCRAGTTTPYWFGESITHQQVKFEPTSGPDEPELPLGATLELASGESQRRRRGAGSESSEVEPGTVGVRDRPCNGWGLYQMHGNVWEWCQDWYGDYPSGQVTNPAGPKEGARRVFRGGSWLFPARRCRSAVRDWHVPGARFGIVGFRFARGQ